MTRSVVIPRRERIVQALATVIAQNGYRDSKIKDVAAIARISLRTFYLEFDDKEAALADLHRSAIDQLIAAIEGTVTFDRPWKEVIRGAFRVYFEILAVSPRLTQALVLEFPTLSPHARSVREAAMQRLEDLLCGLVDDGRRRYPRVQSQPLSPLAARAILGAVDELATSFAAAGGRWELPELVDAATELLWQAIIVQPGSA